MTALAFAQHYADTNCQPDQEVWQRVVDNYGEETARDILVYLRMITFGSLLGNTFDALPAESQASRLQAAAYGAS